MIASPANLHFQSVYNILAMGNEYTFYPDRRAGFLLHLGLAGLLLAAAAYGLLRASRATLSPGFLLDLLPTLIALVAVPVLIYRFLALRNAVYYLQRDGVYLRWGLRQETIPMNHILWVRPAGELEKPLPLPWLSWPGAVIGQRQVPALGTVEFLATRRKGMILMGTEGKAFAVTPADPEGFLRAFRRVNELGSLTPLASESVYPNLLMAEVWAHQPARRLLLAGLALSLVLLVWVSLVVPARSQIALGFRPDGARRDLVPAVRLLLLPILNAFIFVGDLLLGLLFFRRDEHHPLAYLLWAAGSLSPLLFLAALLFILRPG